MLIISFPIFPFDGEGSLDRYARVRHASGGPGSRLRGQSPSVRLRRSFFGFGFDGRVAWVGKPVGGSQMQASERNQHSYGLGGKAEGWGAR